uniref:Uncharacterized protein n=1 Tax=Plectus sambesii TaxID=2011161 RepID=A0A914VRN4_9BILA
MVFRPGVVPRRKNTPLRRLLKCPQNRQRPRPKEAAQRSVAVSSIHHSSEHSSNSSSRMSSRFPVRSNNNSSSRAEMTRKQNGGLSARCNLPTP